MQRTMMGRAWAMLGVGASLVAITAATPAMAAPDQQDVRLARVARDRDRDGIRDRLDRDRDGDGIPNAQDRRPNVRDRNNGYRRRGWGVRTNRQDRVTRSGDDMDGDGIVNWRDNDRDGDGISNSRDRYPNSAGGLSSLANDIDRDGIPNSRDNDRDGDGVPNSRDRYPNSSSRR